MQQLHNNKRASFNNRQTNFCCGLLLHLGGTAPPPTTATLKNLAVRIISRSKWNNSLQKDVDGDWNIQQNQLQSTPTNRMMIESTTHDCGSIQPQSPEFRPSTKTLDRKWALALISGVSGFVFLLASHFSPKIKNIATLVHYETSTKPNFIFMMVDDMGWNSIGYENFDLEYVTPMLNKLAGKGLRMKNYYSQEVCTPARASLLTGRYPVSIGMQFEEVGASAPWGLPLAGEDKMLGFYFRKTF